MSRLLERIGVELPVVQAGMGGGIARAALASAVAEGGGLGTVGFEAAERMRAELADARSRTPRPVAVNLLLPFARRDHWEVAGAADAVFTFWGRPRRRTTKPWLHQVGSEAEARDALAAGVDGLIAQGVEAGGHVRGTLPAHELLTRLRRQLPPATPILLAGDVAEPDDVRRALDAGADGVVLGTRFVMSDEANAARPYKQRLMESRETVLTQLFGMGWPAPHRVIWNEAAERWLAPDGSIPRWLDRVQRASGPVLARLPMRAQGRVAASQRPDRPLFGPIAPTADGPRNLLDAGPLYAGESVGRLHDVRPATDLVRELASAA